MRICKAVLKLPWLPAVWLGLKQWEGLFLTADSPGATGYKKEATKRDFKVWKLSCPLGRQVCMCPSYPRRSLLPVGQGMGNAKAFFRHSHKPAPQSPARDFEHSLPRGLVFVPLLLMVQSVAQQHRITWKLVRKERSQTPPSPTESESAV